MFILVRKEVPIFTNNVHGVIRKEVGIFDEYQLIKRHQKLITNKFVEFHILMCPENMISNIHMSLDLCKNAPKLGERVPAQNAVD